MRMAIALRPPAWLSPRLPVCGDLNMATVLEASGYRPTSGPTAKMIGLSGRTDQRPAGILLPAGGCRRPSRPARASNRSVAFLHPEAAAAQIDIQDTAQRVIRQHGRPGLPQSLPWRSHRKGSRGRSSRSGRRSGACSARVPQRPRRGRPRRSCRSRCTARASAALRRRRAARAHPSGKPTRRAGPGRTGSDFFTKTSWSTG